MANIANQYISFLEECLDKIDTARANLIDCVQDLYKKSFDDKQLDDERVKNGGVAAIPTHRGFIERISREVVGSDFGLDINSSIENNQIEQKIIEEVGGDVEDAVFRFASMAMMPTTQRQVIKDANLGDDIDYKEYSVILNNFKDSLSKMPLDETSLLSSTEMILLNMMAQM